MPFPSWQTIAVGSIGLVLASEVVYHIGTYIHQRVTSISVYKKSKTPDTTVLFFPDSKPTCIPHLSDKCINRNCKFSHEETEFGKLVGYLNSAKKSLDVALYILTSPELTDILCDLEQLGVSIRVIIHSENDDCLYSQTPALKAAGK